MVVFLVLPLSILLCVLSHPLVLAVYHRGAFDDAAVAKTTAAAMILSAGLVPTAMTAVLTRFLYAERAFGRVALAWVITLVAYTAIALGLGNAFGYVGIAIASPISNTLLTIALLFSLPPAARARQELPWRSSMRSIAASVIMAAVLMSVLALVGEPKTLIGQILLGGSQFVVAVVIYALSSWALRSPELPVTITYARGIWQAAKSQLLPG
jgi:putative peptidoglycan lipid II flippase